MELKRNTARGAALVAAGCCVLSVVGAAPGAAQSLSQYQVKAAFIYNFAKFVNWPESSSQSSFVIGILGEDPFRGTLQSEVKNKSIEGQPVVVKQVTRAEDGRNCRILFISASEAGRLPSVLDALKGSPVLTIGETEGFASSGVVINFVIEDDRVRFEVNIDAVEKAQLRISSKVLNLARIVRDRQHRG